MPPRSWTELHAICTTSRAQQATALQQLDRAALRRSRNIIICTFKLRRDVWFFPSACISRPQPAAYSTQCMHCMHTQTLCKSSVIGHLRPRHNTIVYKKCLVHIYTAVTWATLLSLSWGERIHFSHVNCLLFCCVRVYIMLSSGAIFCALCLTCLVKCCTPCDMRASLFSFIYVLCIIYVVLHVLSPGLRNTVKFSLLLPPKNAFIPLLGALALAPPKY